MGLGAEEVAVPEAEQPHQHGQVALERCLGEVPVDGVEAREELLEALRPDREHRRKADRRVHRVPAADPVPEPERVRRIDPERGDRLEVGRDGDDVLRDRRLVAAEAVQQPLPGAPGIRHGLDGREGLRRDDDERLGRLEAAQRLDEVGRVDVRHESDVELRRGVGAKRLVGHRRAEIGATDPDVDHGLNRPAGVPAPRPRPHLLGERGHPVEHVVHLADDVHAVDDERPVARQPQRDVQRRAILGRVDVLAAVHRVAAPRHVSRRSERDEQPHGLLGDEVLREIGVDPGGLEREALDPSRVGGEELAQVAVAHVGVMTDELPPGVAVDEGLGHLVSAGPRGGAGRRLD